MMDYEFRIKVAEKELAHLKEMQRLFAAHQDTHDVSIHALGGRMERVEADLAELTALVKVIGTSLNDLIQTLRGEGRGGNGHAG